MPAIEQSVEIRAPIEAVFAAATDPRRAGEWNPHIVEVCDLEGYPSQLGTNWRQTASMAGRTLHAVCRIVVFNPPHEGVLDVSGDQRAQIITRCEAAGVRTRLVQRVEYAVPSGIAGSLTAAVASPLIQRELSQSLARLRDTVEAEAASSQGW